MKLKKNNTDQKLQGAYYTPEPLAIAIVRLLKSGTYKSILEPSCGNGVFLDALSEYKLTDKAEQITAVEIVEKESKIVKERYKNKKNINVIQDDFYRYYNQNQSKVFDLIIGNPPYIRYQYLEDKQRILQANILKSHGMKANKLINT